MSADIRMVDWQTQSRACAKMHSSVDARYLCGALTDDEYSNAIRTISLWQTEMIYRRAKLVERGYWDHRPKDNR